jgi:DNA-binding XRE family transcriptional regulator
VTSFSKWDRDAYRARVGEEEAARRPGAIMAGQWGYQLAEQRKRLGFTQAGLAEIMGVTLGRVSQIEQGEVSTVEALACVRAGGGDPGEVVDVSCAVPPLKTRCDQDVRQSGSGSDDALAETMKSKALPSGSLNDKSVP